MTSITSIDRPELFVTANALPEGWHYRLDSGSAYIFGQTNPIYSINVVKDDNSIVYNTNSGFYPNPNYTDVIDMIGKECNNLYVQFNSYYQIDQLVTDAKALLGF